MEYEAGEGDEAQARQDGGQALVREKEGGRMVTGRELQAIKQRAARATSGPWQIHVRGTSTTIEAQDGKKWIAQAVLGTYGIGNVEANATFIAHARDDIPTLLAEVERQRAALAALAEQLRQTTAARDDLSQRAMLAAKERYVGADRENAMLRTLLRTLYEGLSRGYCLWCDDTP
ncbi:MAG TPA: hypothetical protein VE258_10875, partial [Ktedonobacterales bacterium]|nr:hypothetical protein [Ktedonobacterales bacterium]